MQGDNTLSPYTVPGFPPGQPHGQTVTVTSSDTAVNDLTTKGLLDYLTIEVLNTGGTALSDFRVQMQMTLNGAWYDYILGSAWSTKDNVMIRQANLPTVAGGSFGWAVIRVDGLYAVKFIAKVASGSTTCIVNWNRKPMARSF